jgi:hypothetical protein
MTRTQADVSRQELPHTQPAKVAPFAGVTKTCPEKRRRRLFPNE